MLFRSAVGALNKKELESKIEELEEFKKTCTDEKLPERTNGIYEDLKKTLSSWESIIAYSKSTNKERTENGKGYQHVVPHDKEENQEHALKNKFVDITKNVDQLKKVGKVVKKEKKDPFLDKATASKYLRCNNTIEVIEKIEALDEFAKKCQGGKLPETLNAIKVKFETQLLLRNDSDVDEEDDDTYIIADQTIKELQSRVCELAEVKKDYGDKPLPEPLLTFGKERVNQEKAR